MRAAWATDWRRYTNAQLLVARGHFWRGSVFLPAGLCVPLEHTAAAAVGQFWPGIHHASITVKHTFGQTRLRLALPSPPGAQV